MPSSESAANTKISTDVNDPSQMTIQSCNALTTTTTIGPSLAGTTDTVTKTSSASAILAGKVPAALETIPEIGSCGSNPKDDHGDSCEDSGKSPKELIQEFHRKISLGTSAPQHTYSDTEYLSSSELLDATSLILTPIELPEALALSPSCTSEQLLDAIVDTENVLPENELRRTASDVCVNVAEHNIDVPIPIIIAEDVRRVSSVADILPPSGVNNRRSQNQRVRFFLEAFKGNSDDEHTDSSSNILDSEDDTSKHGSRARLSSFRDLFRGSRRGKKKKTKRKDSEGEEGSDAHQGHTLKAPKNILKKTGSAESKDSASDDVNNISFDYSTEVEYDSSDDHIWSRAAQKSTLVNNFRRCHSAKCRKKPNYHGEEEDDDFDYVKHVAYSVTEENSLIRGSSFIWRFLHLRQPHHGSSWSNSQFLDSDDGSDVNADNINDEGWDYLQNKHSKLRRSRRSHRSDKRHHDEHSCRHCQPISVKHRVLNLLDHLHLHHRKRKEPFLFSCPERNSRGRIVG